MKIRNKISNCNQKVEAITQQTESIAHCVVVVVVAVVVVVVYNIFREFKYNSNKMEYFLLLFCIVTKNLLIHPFDDHNIITYNNYLSKNVVKERNELTNWL